VWALIFILPAPKKWRGEEKQKFWLFLQKVHQLEFFEGCPRIDLTMKSVSNLTETSAQETAICVRVKKDPLFYASSVRTRTRWAEFYFNAMAQLSICFAVYAIIEINGAVFGCKEAGSFESCVLTGCEGFEMNLTTVANAIMRKTVNIFVGMHFPPLRLAC
jgi:hypothetical protein